MPSGIAGPSGKDPPSASPEQRLLSSESNFGAASGRLWLMRDRHSSSELPENWAAKRRAPSGADRGAARMATICFEADAMFTSATLQFLHLGAIYRRDDSREDAFDRERGVFRRIRRMRIPEDVLTSGRFLMSILSCRFRQQIVRLFSSSLHRFDE
jgi:hypothetical protein